MIGMLRGWGKVARMVNHKTCFRFSSDKEQVYIPMRTLKEDKNVIYTIDNPKGVPITTKVLIFTPFIAVALDGFINEWTNWRIAGSVVFFWLGLRVLAYNHFGKSHQVHTLKVSKDLSKFYITVPNNSFSMRMEQALLEKEGKTFDEKFKECLWKKTLEIPQKLYTELQQASDTQLTSHILFLKRVRNGIVLEISKSDINRIQFISESQMRSIIKKDILREVFNKNKNKDQDLLEPYSAIKQEKNYIVIATKPLKGYNNKPIHFLLNFNNNLDRKYEQYLRALAEGKKIVEP